MKEQNVYPLRKKSLSPLDTPMSKTTEPSVAEDPEEPRPLCLDDYRLVQRALADAETTEVVLRRVYPKIHAVVQSMVGRAHNLDDIVQLAVVEVTRCLDRYHGHGSLDAWATKIAYRKAARVIKRDWKSRLPFVVFNDDYFADQINLDPERSLSNQQLFEVLVSKMARIPSKRRIPLFLHFLYGYTIREVSELTDVPANTVKDRLKTASKEFRSILEKNHPLVTAMLEELP